MAQVNGDTSLHSNNSLFLKHLLTYPVVKDGVSTFQQNQLGQKSIQLSDAAYRTVAGPILPYFTKPYQIFWPYLAKADQLGDETLSKVDERFPAIKKPTGELYADAKSLVFLPIHKGLEGKDHIVGVYSAECSKVRGENLVGYGKALVGTVFAIGSETIGWVSALIGTKQPAGAKELVDEKAHN
jgi:hypothetical protein